MSMMSPETEGVVEVGADVGQVGSDAAADDLGPVVLAGRDGEVRTGHDGVERRPDLQRDGRAGGHSTRARVDELENGAAGLGR